MFVSLQLNYNTIMKTKHAEASRFVRFVVSAFSLMALLVPLPSYGADTGTVKGKITDKADGEGVFGASVTIAGTNIGTSTDANGNFTIYNVPAKQEKVSVSIVGYAPTSQVVSVTTGQTSTANFAIGQTTVLASEVVVGASLYKQNRLDIPVTTNVISKEQIKLEANPTLDRVIEEVPGVVVTRAGGQTTSTIQIRGSNTYQGGGIGTRVQGMYDGFPFNSPESGELVLPGVNMNAADKVEVLKGAAATLYGSGAMGGVVNVFGHLPDQFEVKAGVSGGFYDAPPTSDNSTYRKGYTPWINSQYVGFGNKDGKWTYNIMYSHSGDDGYKENTWVNSHDVKLKARYDIDSKQYLQLTSFYNQSTGGYAQTWPYDLTAITRPSWSTPTYVTHQDQAYDIYANSKPFANQSDLIQFLTERQGKPITRIERKSLPASLSSLPNWPTFPYTIPGLGTIPNAAVLASIINASGALTTYKNYDTVYNDDTIKRKNALVGLNYVNLLSDKLSLDTKLYMTYNDSKIEYNTTNTNQVYPLKTRIPGEFNDTYSYRYGVGSKLDWRASDNHRLLFGVDANIVDVSTTQDAPAYPLTNTYNNVQEKNFAAFLQDEWTMSDRLTALLSVRYDWSGIDAKTAQLTDLTSTTAKGGAYVPILNSVDAISPRIALNYKLADDTSLRASVGQSFRAPTLSERFVREGGLFDGILNPNLDKETMTAYEVGLFKQFSDKFSVDVAGFINNYDNLIESIIDQSNATFQYRNISKARIWGIETSLNYRPTADWNFTTAYTYMNAQNLSYVKGENPTLDLNPDPKWLPMRPEHTLSASATWKTNKNLTLNLNGRYVSTYKAVNFYTSNWDVFPGGFIVLNAGAKYQFTKNISGSLTCKNIGNVQYQEAEWFMAPGRSYVAGVDLTY